jgi:hypothetical protein
MQGRIDLSRSDHTRSLRSSSRVNDGSRRNRDNSLFRSRVFRLFLTLLSRLIRFPSHRQYLAEKAGMFLRGRCWEFNRMRSGSGALDLCSVGEGCWRRRKASEQGSGFTVCRAFGKRLTEHFNQSTHRSSGSQDSHGQNYSRMTCSGVAWVPLVKQLPQAHCQKHPVPPNQASSCLDPLLKAPPKKPSKPDDSPSFSHASRVAYHHIYWANAPRLRLCRRGSLNCKSGSCPMSCEELSM